MQTQFTASQTVEIPIEETEEAGVAIEAYLETPRRIISGLTDPSQVTLLDAETFRFSLKPLSFLSLELRPTADLKIWSPRPGRVRIQALRCWLEGAEHLNQHFSMTMEGSLRVRRQASGRSSGRSPRSLARPRAVPSSGSDNRPTSPKPLKLQPAKILGKADLRVMVDLPLPFSLTPRPVIEAAGNALLAGILGTIQRRLRRQLIEDYQAWAAQQAVARR